MKTGVVSLRGNSFFVEKKHSDYENPNACGTCANGKLLQRAREKKTHTTSGLEITTSVYECGECDGCTLKEKCIRACGSKTTVGQ